MKTCQTCGKAATVHITKIVNGQKQEMHLCQECSEKQQVLKNQELNLAVILQTMIGQHVGGSTDELARLTCPTCGIKYMEFRADGRLGCPKDYEVFRVGLEPILQRIHRAGRHVGKRPDRSPERQDQAAEMARLRKQLRDAIDSEAYEEAARLRDLIRQREPAG